MDGVHDLGGRQGFGPVDVAEPEVPYHHPWEGRMMAMARIMTRAPDWNIDWFRHVRELIGPVDYLSRNYFDQWMQTYSAMLVNSGWATVEEVAAGRSLGAAPTVPPPMTVEGVAAFKRKSASFTGPGPGPAFAVGDTVRTKALAGPGHTRLPGYARARVGRIASYEGDHVLPDVCAVTGERRYRPLYTVAFAAADLWPEAAGSRDEVMINLWEDYLEPTSASGDA
ncbi:MAG: nitrile hydratase subunit beta [Geminicoccaceae bacterium]